MQKLTINKNLLKGGERQIEYTAVENRGDGKYRIYCAGRHNLSSQSKVHLFLATDKIYNDSNILPIIVIDDTSFEIVLPEKEVGIGEAISPNILNPQKRIGEFARDINDIVIWDKDRELHGHLGLEKDEDGNYTNEEDFIARMIIFDTPLSFTGTSYVTYKVDWYLDDAGNFNKEIILTEDGICASVSIGLSLNTLNNLQDTKTILDNNYQALKKGIIPVPIDNEKMRFTPLIIGKNGEKKYANSITFNLHFKSRFENGVLRDNWSTSDSAVWNNYYISSDNKLKSESQYVTDSDGDELNCLGFTEDDIHYQAPRLKRSFIRLAFYNSANPLGRQLLGYSTLFFDTISLATTYSLIKSQKDIDGNPLEAFDITRADRNLRLTAKFATYGVGDSLKPSEGFYQYFYPDEVADENSETDIYMKVEFNHAGYGLTKGLMLPLKDNEVLKTNSQDFPINIPADDLTTYNQLMMIPVKLGYDKTTQEYYYRFPWYTSTENGDIIINLWEPRADGSN